MYQKYPREIKILNRYIEARAEYYREQRTLEEIEALLYGTPAQISNAKVQTSPKIDKLSGQVDRHMDLIKRCHYKQQKAAEEMRKVLELIDGLDTPLYKEVLTKRYIHGQRWEQIAIDLNYTFSMIMKLHNKSIEELKQKYLI